MVEIAASRRRSRGLCGVSGSLMVKDPLALRRVPAGFAAARFRRLHKCASPTFPRPPIKSPEWHAACDRYG